MRSLFALFKNRLFVSILGLLALSIVIWFVGPLIAIAGRTPLASEITRLLVIIICLAFWGVNNLLQQQKVGRANQDLAMSVEQDDIVNLAGQDSQSTEEVVALQSKFNDALKVLQKSTRAKGGVGIYDLPWYIIIGPPGSGKTTALVNSGLKFPLAEEFGKEALRGVGGTRSCDWWFTEEAVLLDTAGRYTTQDSHADVDSAGWVGFLALLKKHRRRRPINGAIVAISLQDLLTQSEQEKSHQINAIKQRLQELNKHLGVKFPVYVMFTKCDLVAGFMEFFDDLGREERNQVWGVSFPYDAKADKQAGVASFKSEFDALIDRLNKRLLGRVQQERDTERRAKIFAFPQQMASMRDLITEFMDDIFSQSRYEDAALLRGAYFTSGTQEGAPIDRVMGALSRSFGVKPQVMSPHGGQGRSYFMSRLLKDVIFEEAELVGVNRNVEIQRRWLQNVAYGGAIGLTILAILGWTTSFTRNEVYVYKAKDAVENYREVIKSNRDIGNFDQLRERLNAARATAHVYQPFDKGVPFLMGMGLYQGSGITAAANNLYQQELEQLLLPTIQYRLEQRLHDNNDSDLLYEALKTYLMLGNKEQRNPELIQLWSTFDWQTIYPDNAEIQGQLQNHVDAMLVLGFDDVQLNGKIVDDTRRYLSAIPRSELMYGLMKRDYIATDSQPLRVSDVMGPKARGIFHHINGKGLDQGLSSFFTYEGYHEQFKSGIEDVAQLASDESWILDAGDNRMSTPEIKKLKEDIEILYFADYIETWDKLLLRLKIGPFNNLRETADALNILASPNSPMTRMLAETVRHTTLVSAGLAGKVKSLNGSATGASNRLSRLFNSASQAVKKTIVGSSDNVVEQHFEPLREVMMPEEDAAAPIERTISLLSQLYGQYDAMSMGIGGDVVSSAKNSNSSDALTRIQIEASRQPEPLRSWMRQIASNGRNVVFSQARNELNELWKSDIYPLCSRAVDGRYPFIKNSSRDITLVDFGRLFGPDGLFDTFYNENLKSFIKVSNGQWSWKTMGGSSIGMSDETLEQFRLAAVIRDTYFQSNGKSPAVNFSLKPIYLDANVRSFNLNLEGQSLRYRHGPARLMRAQWPSAQATGLVRMEFIDDSGASLATSIEGPWAWFRLLDSASLKARSKDIVLATFSKRGRKSTWELRADTVTNPFMMDEVNRFHCVKNL